MHDFRLKLVAGPQHVGRTFSLDPDRSVTIGRRSECTIGLESARVSPVHVRMRSDGALWRIEAGQTTLGHTALLLVNEERRTEAELSPSDEFDVGGHRFRLEDDLPTDPDVAALPALRLNVRRGPAAPEKTFTALAPTSFLLGHSRTALFLLPEVSASRHHCRMRWTNEGWVVEDLSSRNGTFVNGERVARARLAPLDHVRIGRYDVQVDLVENDDESR